MSSQNLILGLPKGSLQNATLDLFEKAGWNIYVSSRSYRPTSDDKELGLRLIRAQEIGRYVDHGFLDCGITGKDWIAENRADVEVICDLAYSRASTNPTRWVLVVPEDSPIKTVEDLEGKRIATESVGLTNDFLKSKGVNAEVEFSWGATEVKVPELVDAIVDVTETGSSLRANKLRIVDTLMESFPQFVANKSSYQDPWKKEKIDRIAMLLNAAQAARDVVGLKMNVPSDDLEKLLEKLPALRNPTVSKLADENWVAIETVLEESVVRTLIPELKSLGAEGIIEYPLNKLVL
ncbi:MAG: ATP phosphoribosyltransferase [Verrucomicrobiota bacterium]|nr:ATP phosphoribosyltransferase [Verrucomicrobiota bacterium]MEC7857302.1 ATP phosphoribosyltransferase [Verrucomicrobiota bacterium]MEC8659051.1 ATP phosphoribosyltransferase [Verrucomicrobiota bacterium]MEC8690432.1 ATP phosphoribosyltransferase [Verrucomicrobiota bacterium]|tara:strand:+ start:1293 stop:2171 length:879 start_codon:yes stop_codon:yes gene_type:complete